MLRKLTSPRKNTRFAGAGTSATAGDAPQALSSLQEAPGPTLDAEPKQPSNTNSPSQKPSSKKSKKTPTPPADDQPTSPQPAPRTDGLALDLTAVAKEDTAASTAANNEAAKPPPLVRTPRQKSMLEEPPDGKPTASSPKKNEAKPRGKRDSLGLKGLMAKREKANLTDAEAKPTNSPTKKEAKSEAKADAVSDKTADSEPALSPIRRKPRPTAEPTDSAPSASNAMAPTLREAASRLPRRSGSSRSSAVPPLQQPELHIIGEIVGGEGFGASADGYCCKWSVDYGNQWIHISGDQIGQTQIDYPANGFPDESSLVWNHPLDLHFAASAVQGWPKLLLQVWRVDAHMKMNVVGYGFVHLPLVPGAHQLKVSMWRPMGTGKEEMAAALLGNTPELATDEVLFNTAWADRCRLKTIATGHVHVEVGIIVRNFDLGPLRS